MGSVCAADDNATLNQENDILSIEEDIDNDIISSDANDIEYEIDNNYNTGEVGSDFQSLKTLIENAGDNSVINLTHDYNYADGSDDNITTGIVINKTNITINGNGYTINAQERTRILQIHGDNVKIYNLTFTGGIALDNDDTIAYWKGGAIYWGGNNGTIVNCNFFSCKSGGTGGAIQWQGHNGTIIDSYFENNQAAWAGGAILWENGNNATILNSTFKSNSVRWTNGGAIFFRRNADNPIVANCLFELNYAPEHGTLYMYGNNAVIYNCTFNRNTGGFSGGAILCYGANGTVDSCRFIENAQLYMDGGAIDWSGRDGKIINSIFINNRCDYNAGAIYIAHNNNLIQNCTFIGNTAKLSGGAIYNWDGDNCTINNCTFMDNSADFDGGAICWWGLEGTLSNNIIINNAAKHDAGGIQWIGNNGTIINCTIVNNTASNNGGAIQWFGNNGTIMNSIIENNTAYNAGGIYWAGNNETVSDMNIIYRLGDDGIGNNGTIINSTIVNNAAYNDGGAIYWKGNNGTLSMSKIENNNAKSYGSAIFLNNNYTIKDSIILSNKGKGTLINVNDDFAELFILIGANNYINGVYANSTTVDFDNVTYWNGKILNTDIVGAPKTSQVSGINITLEIYDSNGALVDNITKATENGMLKYDTSSLSNGDYVFKACHGEDSYYSSDEIEGKFTVNGKPPASVESKFNIDTGKTTTYAVDTAAGEKATPVSFKLTDSNNKPIANADVKITYKNICYNKKTDANGIVYLDISNNAAGKYVCTLTYLGHDQYKGTFAAFTIKLQKKSVTIKAKAKTFKASKKTKKYSITLKTKAYASKNGKAYLKAGKKVTLKVKGKTYTAKINKKGKATFKITKLNKKGKYKALIRFAGDSTYKAAKKTVKLTIKK